MATLLTKEMLIYLLQYSNPDKIICLHFKDDLLTLKGTYFLQWAAFDLLRFKKGSTSALLKSFQRVLSQSSWTAQQPGGSALICCTNNSETRQAFETHFPSMAHLFFLHPDVVQTLAMSQPESVMKVDRPKINLVLPMQPLPLAPRPDPPVVSFIAAAKRGSLFLGTFAFTQQAAALLNANVQAVINVRKEKALDLLPTLHIPVEDTWHQNIGVYLLAACEFIDGHLEVGSVLVYCQAGISRSATIVIAYVMYQQRQAGVPANLTNAYEQVKAARSCISPNLDFMGALLHFEKTLNAAA